MAGALKCGRCGCCDAGMRPNSTLNIAPEYSTNSPSDVSPWLPAAALDYRIETAGRRAQSATDE